MTQFFGYIFRQTLWPTLFVLFLLTGVVWLTQGLRLLDVVINRGQTAATFVELTIYVLPSLLTLILPLALFFAVLYTLNRLYTDSEVVVMWSAGLGRWAIARPILLLGGLFTVLSLFLNLYLMPLGYRTMKDKVYEIRADIATGLFREGAFTYPVKGLAVYVQEVTPSGELRGIFVNDRRDPKAQRTHTAQSARLVRTSSGPMLIMRNGVTVSDQDQTGGNPVFVQFEEQQYLPEEFNETGRAAEREYTERYLSELLFPDPTIPWEAHNRGRLISEGHMRLATPLYNIALPMIALVSLLCGNFSRRGFGYRIALAVAAGVLVRVAGVGVHSMVQAHLGLLFLHYLIPLLTILVCAMLLSGVNLLPQFRRAAQETR